MLFYAECGVSFTLEFGDIDEPFYNSVESVFSDGLKTLKRCGPDIADKLLPRFVDAVQSTDGMGSARLAASLSVWLAREGAWGVPVGPRG
jgi:hypothetical protein